MVSDVRDRTYVALDLETTGLSPESDAIIEIGAVKFRGDETIDVFHSLINPFRPLPYRIQILCGIRPPDLEMAPSFSMVEQQLLSFLGNHTIIGHNIGFDLAFLRQAGLYLANPAYDTLDMVKLVLPSLLERTLSAVAMYLGIRHESAHRALGDAEVGREIFRRLIERLYRLDPAILAELARLTRNTDWSLRDLLQEVAYDRGGSGILSEGAFESACFATEPEEAVEPLVGREKTEPLGVEALTGLLGTDGPFDSAFPGYEVRSEQIEMLGAVAQAMNNGDHLIVEAGTGVGKSMAYLLPAMLFSLQNSTPVVISTYTINLQEQLVKKDIPDMLRALRDTEPWPVSDLRVAQVKGRTNYLCVRRWDIQRRMETLPPEGVQLLTRIQVWLPSTRTGDRSEINLDVREAGFWYRLCAQSFDCLGRQCSYQQRGLCFLHRARRAAHSAHLIVVNHALLLSETAMGAQVLPEYGYLIVDEAHHLEGVATDQLGAAISEGDVTDILDQMLIQRDDRRAGLLPQLEALARSFASPERKSLEQLCNSSASAVERARSRVATFFGELNYFVQGYGEAETEYDLSLRITRAMRTQPGWSDVEIACENMVGALDAVGRTLEKIGTILADAPIPEALALEVHSILNSLNALSSHSDSIVFHHDDNTVHWTVLSRRNNSIALHSAPLHVGSLLQDGLYRHKESIVLTSATLSTAGNFDHLKGRLGFEHGRELLLGSPYDYERAALIYLANDVPEPGKPGYQETVAQALVSVCRAVQGRCLVLFTSHALLRATQAAIQGPLEEDDILVLGQGIDGSPRKLLASLKDNPRTVLLGAASFWEGVDVVGDALSLLVIVRLPFSVPTDPVFAARSETFENPFTEYALPEAAFRFKQGFGRLIRSRTDRGAMAVLDSRIVHKPYGSVFVGSLPPCRMSKGPVNRLPHVVVEWLAGDSSATARPHAGSIVPGEP